jgi:hypothetical protein
MANFQVLENVVSPDVRNEFLNFFSEHPQRIIKPHGPETLHIRHLEADLLFKKVDPLIKSLFPQYEVVGGNFFQTSVPYIVHSDNVAGLSGDGYNLLLPLEKVVFDSSVQGDTYFVLFEQKCEVGPGKFFFNSDISAMKTGYPHFYDHSLVKGISQNSLIDDQRLSHLQPQWLEGLSVGEFIPWRPGDLIVFPASQLHCSSNFVDENVNHKKGLSIFIRVSETL